MNAMILFFALAAGPAFAATTTLNCQGNTLLGGVLTLQNNWWGGSKVTFTDRHPAEFRWTGKEPKLTSDAVATELSEFAKQGAKLIGTESLPPEGSAKVFTVFESKTKSAVEKSNEKLYVESAILDGTQAFGLIIYASTGWSVDSGNESSALISNCR